MTADRRETGPADGKPTDKWAFLLPAGWARFPTGDGRGHQLDDAVDQVVARTFPDPFPDPAARADADSHRKVLRDSLREAFGAAGTGAVYLPTATMAGMAIPASIVETELFGVVGQSPVEVAASILGDAHEESSSVELDGRPGVRLASTVGEVAWADGRPVAGTRQVTYVVSRDEAAGDWLVLSFGAVWDTPGTERLAGVLVEFFDAVMATFRWTGAGAEPVGLPERTVPGSA
ncbi:hypothetical protein [Promicromonospora sp. NPDC057488]|uniref:hypothetical protein n=1 Tax=Promicromonospora sp. NPDC057488 TaxID=3346147 RepID=UPI003670BCD7